MTYAKGTSVTVQSSQMEISRILDRYGVDSYRFGAAPGVAMLEFVYEGMPVKLTVPLPAKPTDEKLIDPKTRRYVLALPRWEQAVREAWRALVLFIKAALESVERGIVKAEQAFMAFLVTGTGETLGDRILPEYRAQLAIEAAP
jgi:hypothetical protein